MAAARMTRQVTRDDVTTTTVLEVEAEESYPDAVDECVTAVTRLWGAALVDEES